MTVVFTVKHDTDFSGVKDHVVAIRQGSNTVRLKRKDLVEIFGVLKDMKQFFGPLGS